MSEERFSINAQIKAKKGEPEKNTDHTRATKKSNRTVSKSGSKYITKIVDGVKYMTLRNQL